MQLTLDGIQNRDLWNKAGIILPSYDVKAAQEKAKKDPLWVHFGIGNIFRVFIGGIADGLMEKGLLDRGLTCVEAYDYEIVDRIYTPFDDLALSVILEPDGARETRVLGSLAEAVRADSGNREQWERLKEIFRAPSLQLVSFTITEKGYALKAAGGEYLGYMLRDIENGPDSPSGAMGILTSMLYERYLAGGTPIALVSMDNCAKNGLLLKSSVQMMAEEWSRKGSVEESFLLWLEDPDKVAFNSTMIDKITPRPSEAIAADLMQLGVECMDPVITEKRSYIAPFTNAERPQYLVIEDRFPNGRPPLEEGFGVYMGDFDTVCKAERMKVTACLNPGHTAVGPLGVVFAREMFADMLRDLPVTLRMAERVIYGEGLPMVDDPGIIPPKAFTDEVFKRFKNVYLGDTNLRLATDASQGLSVRFGETIKAYVKKEGSAERLTAIPLGIAGFFRYMMAVDDWGRPYELAPDPMAEEIHEALKDVRIGEPETYTGQLKPFLSSAPLFGVDLYGAGIGEKIEGMFREMISKPGAAYRTVVKYISE